MNWFTYLLSLLHVVGFVLAVGSASVKLTLLLRCKKDSALLAEYIPIVRPITKLIVLGLIAVTMSGIGWLLLGYPFTTLLILKTVLVGIIWVLGPLIDNVFEPRFLRLAPAAGQAASHAFKTAFGRYLAVELAATLLFYVIIAIGLLL